MGLGLLAFCAAAKIHEVQSDRSGSSSAAGPVKAVEPSGEAVEVAEVHDTVMTAEALPTMTSPLPLLGCSVCWLWEPDSRFAAPLPATQLNYNERIEAPAAQALRQR